MLGMNEALMPSEASRDNSIAILKCFTFHSTYDGNGQMPFLPPDWAELTQKFDISALYFWGKNPRNFHGTLLAQLAATIWQVWLACIW